MDRPAICLGTGGEMHRPAGAAPPPNGRFTAGSRHPQNPVVPHINDIQPAVVHRHAVRVLQPDLWHPQSTPR
ncbi:MAG UNVERIFIED_CONTAM: hypothetical protein LVR18_42465 [Planctomycetaceae bacterium]